jgi:thiol-disulfide isomerase/thioredoxin
MNPKKSLLLLAFALLFAAPLRAATEEKTAVPFRSLAFDAACAAAKDEGKLVFIDFYTTWCGPCKELDKTTWRDAGVGKLVGEKAVALKLDAEKEGKDQAKRYKIDAYPTLLLLKPDGMEVDRIVGFREPAKFTEEFAAGVAGKPALVRAADAVAAVAASGSEAVKARYAYAKELAQNHQFEEALAQYLWCYDEGMAKEPGYAGVRSSYLLSDLSRLGRDYPPALAALRERRDTAQQQLLANAGGRGVASDFATLNQALQEDARTLEIFDQLPPNDSRRVAMGYSAFKLLVKGQRYADALAITPYARMAAQYDRYAAMAAEKKSDMLNEANRYLVVNTAAEAVEVLAGAGDLAHARELLGKVLAFDASDETKAAMRQRAMRAGHPELLEPAAK